jgi:hypothetical protein
VFSSPCYQHSYSIIISLIWKIIPYLLHIFFLLLCISMSNVVNNNCTELNKSRETKIWAYPRYSSPLMEFKISLPCSKVPALSWARYILSKTSLPSPIYVGSFLILSSHLLIHGDLSSGLFPSVLVTKFLWISFIYRMLTHTVLYDPPILYIFILFTDHSNVISRAV